MSSIPDKQCGYCQKTIRGRSDKKFCNDYCRNYFNQKRKAEISEPERKINRILSRNRKILHALSIENNFVRLDKNQLLSEGFDLRFCTEVASTKAGHTCFFCYEFGYMIAKKDLVILFYRSRF